MDSIAITIIRTGAATGVAAKYLSRKNSSILAVVGCGNQGRVSVQSICTVMPIETVFLYDIDPIVAGKLCSDLQELNIEVNVAHSIRDAVKMADIVVTCTPSTQPIIPAEHVRPGTFIAAVGADSETKHEIDPVLFSASKIVVDSLDQASAIGDLHHAIDVGIVTRESVHAELGQVIAGIKSGRTSDDEIIIFDSTGTGLQDVAAASIVFERATERGVGVAINLSA